MPPTDAERAAGRRDESRPARRQVRVAPDALAADGERGHLEDDEGIARVPTITP